MSYKFFDISVFNGKTIKEICQSGAAELKIYTTEGNFVIQHHQDCCEYVRIFDVYGNFSDFIGKKIESANDVIVSGDWPVDVPSPEYVDSYTWTTHTFVSEDGNVLRVRWLGESNGYYGEGVSIDEF